MASTARTTTAVTAGAIAWAVLWVGGAALAGAIWPNIIVPNQRLEHSGALVGYILYSVMVSVAAGYLTARITQGAARAVPILAAIQLALGLVIELSAWDKTPVWYHIVFLALLVPALLFGGSLWKRRSAQFRHAEHKHGGIIAGR
ncbi:MAG TPA: hypothetical protein VFZ04_02645 [Longimicrobiales bacterium]